ncbi:MAG: hypothetical protein AVDCRST_MAG76-1660, partial [uncultured Acidimicrobiales bacterium]
AGQRPTRCGAGNPGAADAGTVRASRPRRAAPGRAGAAQRPHPAPSPRRLLGSARVGRAQPHPCHRCPPAPARPGRPAGHRVPPPPKRGLHPEPGDDDRTGRPPPRHPSRSPGRSCHLALGGRRHPAALHTAVASHRHRRRRSGGHLRRHRAGRPAGPPGRAPPPGRRAPGRI